LWRSRFAAGGARRGLTLRWLSLRENSAAMLGTAEIAPAGPACREASTGMPSAARQHDLSKVTPGRTPAWGRLWDAEQRKGECRRA